VGSADGFRVARDALEEHPRNVRGVRWDICHAMRE
jgi:hypothetical protein